MKGRTLSRNIAVALFVLIGLISIFYIFAAVKSTQLYQQEIQQKLNLTLAQHIAKDIPLLEDGSANQQALKELFHTLMIVNPGIELYLVDTRGSIMAYNAPPGKVRMDQIDLEYVHELLNQSGNMPIKGTDPRNPDRRKVFSAAPVYENQKLAGYLYIVLGGENYDNVVEMIKDSYILRLLFWIGISAFILSLCAGLLSFNWLTRRIRIMSNAVEGFKNSEFKTPITLPGWKRNPGGDEIEQMGKTIEQMSLVIMDQFRQLRESDVTRRELIANISHDLRTPLTSMQGYLETLQMKKSDLSDAEQARYLELAIKHSKRLSSLIADLFELAMLESPDSKAHIENFSLAELVQDVIQKFELKAVRKELQVNSNIPENAPLVMGDIAMIERVLENLIENAVKFTDPGGAIEIAVNPANDNLELKITDTGIGIPNEQIPNLFQRFYYIDKSRSDQTESNGLGLAIAHRILQLHNSTISVESIPGKGSCFSFNLSTAA